MANPLLPLAFQLSGPVVVEQRPSGLALRAREGEIHVASGAALPPAAWLMAASAGVSARQQPDGGWELRIDEFTGSAASPGGALSPSPWVLPTSALRWHRPLPGLLQPLGEPFRASPAQRLLGRTLVRMLGLPGVVPLLIRWHRRRTRQRA